MIFRRDQHDRNHSPLVWRRHLFEDARPEISSLTIASAALAVKAHELKLSLKLQ
jgi:hypothetical protein